MSQRMNRTVIIGLALLVALPLLPATAADLPEQSRAASSWCGTNVWGIERALARHELNKRRLRTGFGAQSTFGDQPAQSGPVVYEERDVAVIEDDGSIVIDRNPFDYADSGVRFSRRGSRGFKVKTLGGDVKDTLGERLALGDDDSERIDLRDFVIPFYDTEYDSVYINSDGNLTFGRPENASTARDVQRLLNGPPRVAPFFADLDPSAAAGDGGVYLRFAGEKIIVTWWNVPNFDEVNSNTFQVTINSRGNIDVRFAAVDSKEGIVGAAPGGGSGVEMIDLTDDLPLKRRGVAILERFSNQLTVDDALAAQTFFDHFADDYDQLVLFTDFNYLLDGSPRTLAYHITVNNQVQGIGVPRFNGSRFFGSRDRLGGFIAMGNVRKYPDDLRQTDFLNDLYSSLDILAHEIGHQWLVSAAFVDGAGQISRDLLGRGDSHWSFYFDSDASFLEGNEIRDNGDGSFTTERRSASYNALDLYLMGLFSADEVPDFFYVRAFDSRDTDTAAPEAGVTFEGTRVNVTINDVLAAMGQRRPTRQESPKDFEVGFILLTKNGRQPAAGSINQVNDFARKIEGFFRTSTRTRGSIDSRLELE